MERISSFLLSIGVGELHLQLLTLSISAISCVLILMVILRRQKPVEPPIGERAPVLGKLEKLERTVNEFRSELLRALELLRLEKERLGGATPSAAESVQEGEEDKRAEGAETDRGGPSNVVAFERPEESARPLAEPPGERETQNPADGKVVPDENRSIFARLLKTRSGFFSKLGGLFSRKPTLDEGSLDELYALLVASDFGVKMAGHMLELVKNSLVQGGALDRDSLIRILEDRTTEVLTRGTESALPIDPQKRAGEPLVVLVVGVNGVGKTTSCAKLAHQWKGRGANVLLVAADTFRAAAVQQLSEWGERLGVTVVRGAEDAKPSTVVFDGVERAKREGFDVVIIDTAGRLQTKINLMQELEGVRNAVARHVPGAPHETLLVLDGSTGQNAVSQAREFHDAVNLSGVIVTKLDGTARGGIVVAIKEEFGIPVRYIGVGEGPDDLREFNAREFSAALFAGGDSERSHAPAAAHAASTVTAHAAERRRRRAAEA